MARRGGEIVTSERQYIILCGGSQGRAIVCGYVDSEPVSGEPVTLHDARMVLRWDAECGGLFGLAAGGPKGDTRMTPAVPQVTDTDWQQWMETTEDGGRGLRGWK